MASDTQPSTINIALVGWRDALRAIIQMMSVAGPAFLLTLISLAVYQLSRGHSVATDIAMSLVLSIAQSLVLTPLAIAVHRYVLLDEVTRHYALNLADQRFQRFFCLALAIQALWLSGAIWLILGRFIVGGSPFSGEPITPGAEGRVWVLLVCFAAALITGFVVAGVILSIAILFPAVAIDAPGAGWRNAMDDSKGHIYRIFCIMGLALVPMIPFAVAELTLAPEGFDSSLRPHPAIQTIGVVLRAVELILIVSAFASIASRLYLAFGRRLNGVAPVA